MDADLARAARGQAVAPETEEAATQVLRGAGATTLASAPTEIVRRPPATVLPPVTPPPYGPPTGFYEYDEPIRRRSVWPWLLALLLVGVAVAAGWYVYTKIQDQLNQTKPVAVPLVEGSRGAARRRRRSTRGGAAGARAPVCRATRSTSGRVFDQKPAAGERIDKGNTVEILVSTGKPKVTVPSVIGKQATDAVAALTEQGLKANVHRINSDKESGTVTGQYPKAGTRLVKGDSVRINVSEGPKPIAVPPVVGVPYEQAAATLQGAGFAVARRDVDSNEPRGRRRADGPGREHARGTRLDGDAVRLEGTDRVGGPRRDQLQPHRRDRDAAQLGLQGGRPDSSTPAIRPRTASS